jgi:hypothetical protein
VGFRVGECVGEDVGLGVAGTAVGERVGAFVGEPVGVFVGACVVGSGEGGAVGRFVGGSVASVGSKVENEAVGIFVGLGVCGLLEGGEVSETEGLAEGTPNGGNVNGAKVGAVGTSSHVQSQTPKVMSKTESSIPTSMAAW